MPPFLFPFLPLPPFYLYLLYRGTAIADGLRRELVPYGISVSSIAPVFTPSLNEAPKSSLYEHLYAEDRVCSVCTSCS